MQRPNKNYFLYVKPEHPLHELNYTHVEILDENSETVTVSRVGFFGSREGEPVTKSIKILRKASLGEGFSRVRYVSGGEISFLQSQIKSIECSKYLCHEKEVWLLWTVFGFDKTLDALLESEGFVTDEFILNLARNSEQKFKLVGKTKLMPFDEKAYTEFFTAKGESIEQLSAADALVRYGLASMEYAIEKTYAVVPVIGEEVEI